MKTISKEKGKFSVRFHKNRDKLKTELQDLLKQEAEKGNEMETYREILIFLMDAYHQQSANRDNSVVKHLKEITKLKHEVEEKDKQLQTLLHLMTKK